MTVETLIIIFSVLVPLAGLFLVLRADVAENRRATEDIRKTTEDLRVGLAMVQAVLQMQGYYRPMEVRGREGGEGRSGGGDSV